MCGIITYIGNRKASEILIEGLKRLEYRGYDSAGLAVLNGELKVVRSVGKIRQLDEKLRGVSLEGTVGIAHTRWATHGPPTEVNAHPQTNADGSLAVIHNGIIENYRKLKNDLEKKGYEFVSDTDTEVFCHLITDRYEGDLQEAIKQALIRVQGTFGLAVIHKDHPDTIVAARRGSPLVLGIGNGELLVASDVSALVRHTKRVIYLEDNEIATLSRDGFQISTLDDRNIDYEIETLDWDIEAAERNGYPHFTLKEIFEGPEAVVNAIRGRLLAEDGLAKLGGLEDVLPDLLKKRHLIIVSCGTSYYAGMTGRYILEELTDLSVEVELASEFRYRKLNISQDTAVLAISQSGETADTLAAIKEAKRKGALVLGLVNVVGSQIARETHAGVYNHAGPEIGVASTKAFISQLSILLLIGMLIGRHRNLSIKEGRQLVSGLLLVPDQIQAMLDKAEHIEAVCEKYASCDHFLFIGRKYSYPIALEGALKLKELSYLHAEGYAAGEMKHGPIAYIDEQFTVVCVAPQDSMYEKIVSNLQEVKARGARVLAIVTENDREVRELADDVITIPRNREILQPLLSVVPLQLLAYYIASFRERPIDRPRNLAKSVTVE